MSNEVKTKKAPSPNGHYSQAIEYNGTIYASCQLGLDNEKNMPKSFKDEVNNCLNNIHEVIKAGGGDLSTIVKVTIYISDINLWLEVNELYVQFMGSVKPSRSVVPVSILHNEAKIGIEAIAFVK